MRFDLAINGMTKGFFQNGKIPILRDGNQWRPFVHVRDTVKAQLTLLEINVDKINKEIINVGSNSQNYQIFDLAKRVAKSIGLEFNYEWYGDPDHRSYQVNFNKASELLKFNPDYNAEKGAREVWDALNSGQVDPNDIQTITLKWYQKLISDGVFI
jgi:nucleoside-diphosphate-sugar epimerase